VDKIKDNNVKVRWFKYQKAHNPITKGYNMYVQNAIETNVSLLNINQFIEALLLTRINKESLVFKYDDGKNPNVLFSADSDFSFTKNIFQLKDKSIITVPHHGSNDNTKSYKKINGSELIMVRSDRKQNARPCQAFCKFNATKYCTICRNQTSKDKVELEFKNNVWITNANTCTCC